MARWQDGKMASARSKTTVTAWATMTRATAASPRPTTAAELIGLWRKWKVGFYGEVSTYVRTIQATYHPANYF